MSSVYTILNSTTLESNMSLEAYGHRKDTMLLFAYQHGLHISALIHLQWDQIDCEQGLVHVRRCTRPCAP